MERKDIEIKAFGLSRLLAGMSYRQAQDALKETYGQTVALSTLSAWAHESPEQAHAISQARVRQLANQRVEAAQLAGEIFIDHLAAIQRGDREVSSTQAGVMFGIASDKFDSMVRISQDEKKQNPLLEQLRMQLRAKSPAELKAIILDRDDDSHSLPPDPPSQEEIRRYHGLPPTDN